MSKADTELKDDAILLYAQSGSNRYIEELIKKYPLLVKAIAGGYSDTPAESDDLIQDGMIGLLAAIKSYDGNKGASFKTYAGVCIDNSIQTSIRKFHRQKDITLNSIVEYRDEELPSHRVNISAEDTFIAKESVYILNKTLDENLSDFENEVLRLHIVGCSYSKIAKKLCKSPKAVDNALQRIRKKLASIKLRDT
ncbi:MAG: sigma-70 family RNA polymerase sigma factor [Clostridiales bacterium]|nr:sigma-70 family RNA polymerase sigma factor [Clostridiales bacterium]